MKNILFIFLASNACYCFTNKSFEGIITYDGFSTVDSSKYIMKVYYGKNKMKLESIEKGSNIHEENSKSILYNFEKGIQYTIDTLFETIEIDSLKYSDAEDPETEFLPTAATKNILTINCRLYNVKTKIDDSLLVVPGENWSIWFTENNKYIIPEAYRNKRSLLTAQDGNCIWLETTISFKSPFPRNKGATETISNKAILIEQQSLPDSIFNLPADYRLKYRDHGPVHD